MSNERQSDTERYKAALLSTLTSFEKMAGEALCCKVAELRVEISFCRSAGRSWDNIASILSDAGLVVAPDVLRNLYLEAQIVALEQVHESKIAEIIGRYERISDLTLDTMMTTAATRIKAVIEPLLAHVSAARPVPAEASPVPKNPSSGKRSSKRPNRTSSSTASSIPPDVEGKLDSTAPAKHEILTLKDIETMLGAYVDLSKIPRRDGSPR